MSRTALYRFYDDSGDLLYVGISVNPWSRWKQHKGGKDWAEDVRSTEIEWYDTRHEAMAAEKAAIIAEEPRYNVQHSVIRHAADPVPRLTIIAVCTTCGTPIAPHAGSLQIDLDMVVQAESRPDFDGTARELMALEFPEWEFVHHDCDPDPERHMYVLPLSRIHTLAGFLETTAHLMNKPWISVTNWSSILYAITIGSGESPLMIPREFL